MWVGGGLNLGASADTGVAVWQSNDEALINKSNAAFFVVVFFMVPSIVITALSVLFARFAEILQLIARFRTNGGGFYLGHTLQQL